METHQLDMVSQIETHIIDVVSSLTLGHIEIPTELLSTETAFRNIEIGSSRQRYTDALGDDAIVLIDHRKQSGGTSGTTLYKKTAAECKQLTVIGTTSSISLLCKLEDIIRWLREEQMMAMSRPDIHRVTR